MWRGAKPRLNACPSLSFLRAGKTTAHMELFGYLIHVSKPFNTKLGMKVKILPFVKYFVC